MINHCPPSIAADCHTVTERFIHSDHHRIGSHSGGFFTKLVFDKIAAHPWFRPDPDFAQLDVIPSRTVSEKQYTFRMGSVKTWCAGIKIVSNI
jgi:hypothetical protein